MQTFKFVFYRLFALSIDFVVFVASNPISTMLQITVCHLLLPNVCKSCLVKIKSNLLK